MIDLDIETDVFEEALFEHHSTWSRGTAAASKVRVNRDEMACYRTAQRNARLVLIFVLRITLLSKKARWDTYDLPTL